MESCAKYMSVGLGKRRSEKSLVKTLWSTALSDKSDWLFQTIKTFDWFVAYIKR